MQLLLAENTLIAERYKLTRMIGRGGMGTVWQATNVRLDVPCAIKFIEGQQTGDVVALTRFEREAKAAAQIRSAHVVQVLDHGTFQGTPYIAMELLEGEDLGRRLGRVMRMSPHDVAAIVTHVSRALTKAHAMEIVHRDLKPENIFLAWDDDRELAKVLDFGIAKRVQVDVPSQTATGAMLGTPAYMSPEQARGAPNVDYRSDLWAMGVIAFRCLTGVLPFRGESLGELLIQIVVSPLPVPSRTAVDVPPGFDAWWERAASRNADQRFQSARELAEALRVALGVPPLTDGLERRQREAGSLPNERLPALPPGAPPQVRSARATSDQSDQVAFLPTVDAGSPWPNRASPLAVSIAATPAPLRAPPVASPRGSGATLLATSLALLALGVVAVVMIAGQGGAKAPSPPTTSPEVLAVPGAEGAADEAPAPAPRVSGSASPRPTPSPRPSSHP